MSRIVLFEEDTEIAAALVSILSREKDATEIQSTGDWNEVKRSLAGSGTKAVVIGPDADDSDLAHVLSASREHPDVGFVMVAAELEAQLMQKAMRHGIHDVVAAHDSEKELGAAVARTVSMASSSTPVHKQVEDHGQVVSVFGPKGGTGKTTVAVNLAVSSALSGMRVALLDADVRFGDCATLLRLRPERTLADLAGLPDEPDEVVLQSVLSHHESGVALIAAPSEPSLGDAIDDGTITRVLRALRRSFQLVVVDTAPSLDGVTSAALSASDIALLVTTPEITAMKDSHLALTTLELRGVDLTGVSVVVNRSDSKVGFPTSEIEPSLKRKVVALLPSEVAVPMAANQGLPVGKQNPKSKVARAIEKLASDLATDSTPESRKPSTKSVFARAVRFGTNS